MSANPATTPIFILCGGLGTRLKEETEFRPKPMVPIGGRPTLWHVMRSYSPQPVATRRGVPARVAAGREPAASGMGTAPAQLEPQAAAAAQKGHRDDPSPARP